MRNVWIHNRITSRTALSPAAHKLATSDGTQWGIATHFSTPTSLLRQKLPTGNFAATCQGKPEQTWIEVVQWPAPLQPMPTSCCSTNHLISMLEALLDIICCRHRYWGISVTNAGADSSPIAGQCQIIPMHCLAKTVQPMHWGQEQQTSGENSFEPSYITSC